MTNLEIIMKIAISYEFSVNFTPKKTTNTFNFLKKKKNSDIAKMVVFVILGPDLRPLLGIENFFSIKFNLVLQFFGVELTGNYYVVGIIS